MFIFLKLDFFFVCVVVFSPLLRIPTQEIFKCKKKKKNGKAERTHIYPVSSGNFFFSIFLGEPCLIRFRSSPADAFNIRRASDEAATHHHLPPAWDQPFFVLNLILILVFLLNLLHLARR